MIYPYAQQGPMGSMMVPRQSGPATSRGGAGGGDGGSGGGGAGSTAPSGVRSPAMAQRMLQQMQQLNQTQLQINQLQQLQTMQRQGGGGGGQAGGASAARREQMRISLPGTPQNGPMRAGGGGVGPRTMSSSDFASLMQAANSSGMTAAALRSQLPPPSVATSAVREEGGLGAGAARPAGGERASSGPAGGPNPNRPLRNSSFPLPQLQRPLRRKGEEEPDYTAPRVNSLASFRAAWQAHHRALEGKRVPPPGVDEQPIERMVRDQLVSAIYRGTIDIVRDTSITGMYSVNKPPGSRPSRREGGATTGAGAGASAANPSSLVQKNLAMVQQLNSMAGLGGTTYPPPGLTGLMQAALMGATPGIGGASGMGRPNATEQGMGKGTNHPGVGPGDGSVRGGGGGTTNGMNGNTNSNGMMFPPDDSQNIGKKKKPKRARLSKNSEGAASLTAAAVRRDGAPTSTMAALARPPLRNGGASPSA